MFADIEIIKVQSAICTFSTLKKHDSFERINLFATLVVLTLMINRANLYKSRISIWSAYTSSTLFIIPKTRDYKWKTQNVWVLFLMQLL